MPIANIGLQVGIPVASEYDSNVLYHKFEESNLGLPDKNGNFKYIDDSSALFDTLPEKDEKYNYPVKPTKSDWYKTEPKNADHKKTFNSRGMIIKKLRFKDNNGKKLIQESQCIKKKELWESVEGTGLKTYNAYNHKGGPGKTYDETNTSECDNFYKYYGQKTIRDRGCVIPDPDNKNSDIIDINKPGCGSTIQVPQLQPPQTETFVEWFDGEETEGSETDKVTNEAYFYNAKGVGFSPEFHYPNDLACINSPYGSVYTDKKDKAGKTTNEYAAGAVFPVDASIANPIGIDTRCKGNINNPVGWGEAYTTTEYRKQANSVKCVNAMVLNNIKAESVEISDIQQTNDCDTNTSKDVKEEIDAEGDEVQDPDNSDLATAASDDVKNEVKKENIEADKVQEETAKQNQTREPSTDPDPDSDSKNNIQQIFEKHKLLIAGGGGACLLFIILLIFIMKK